MNQLEIRYNTTQHILDTLRESLTVMNNPQYRAVNTQLRDSVIRRFRFSADLFWKLIRDDLYQKDYSSNKIATAKDTARGAFNSHLINEQECKMLTTMIEARTLIPNAYKEAVAQ